MWYFDEFNSPWNEKNYQRCVAPKSLHYIYTLIPQLLLSIQIPKAKHFKEHTSSQLLYTNLNHTYNSLLKSLVIARVGRAELNAETCSIWAVFGPTTTCQRPKPQLLDLPRRNGEIKIWRTNTRLSGSRISGNWSFFSFWLTGLTLRPTNQQVGQMRTTTTMTRLGSSHTRHHGYK